MDDREDGQGQGLWHNLGIGNHGDKRQFTLLASTAASGESLPHQVVVTGATSKSLPKSFGKYKYTTKQTNTVGKVSVGMILVTACAVCRNVASFCATYNHWADDVTSRAYVKDVLVP